MVTDKTISPPPMVIPLLLRSAQAINNTIDFSYWSQGYNQTYADYGRLTIAKSYWVVGAAAHIGRK
jgi:hypothetical protein